MDSSLCFLTFVARGAAQRSKPRQLGIAFRNVGGPRTKNMGIAALMSKATAVPNSPSGASVN
jgi:hypothetical protein